MRKALYAGSFDPFTNGHLSIVKEASELFDEVIVCIASNSQKQRFTSAEKMKNAMQKCFEKEGLDNCKVVIYDKLIADYCNENNIKYLVRGLRNTSDYLYEENIAKINNEINPTLKTVYFRAQNDTISSSMVKEFIKYSKNIATYVPNDILKLLYQ